jgi:alanine racemase
MIARRAQASVNVAAIERNCSRLRSQLQEGVAMCAVVKADGYGHGAAECARAALEGGASWLAVASGQEARELREAGVLDPRVLVMGALSPLELKEALAADADVVVWHEQFLAAVAAAGGGRVHVKFDSGMGRLGTRDAEEASRVLRAAREASGVEAVGAMTHFATADDLDDDGFFARQLDTFTRWVGEVRAEHPHLLVHAANSAATLRDRAAHFDMVRCGIAVYGMDPFGEASAGVPTDDAATDAALGTALGPSPATALSLEPALELCSYVAEVKAAAKGESAGYGRRFVAEADTFLAVLPIGYGDGWRRGLSNNADVLIGGRRYPLVGTVSMDNITVDLGADSAAERLRGETAILIGAQGGDRISAEEVAGHLHTINYEVTCAITPRVGRVYHRDGAPAGTTAVSAAHPPEVSGGRPPAREGSA